MPQTTPTRPVANQKYSKIIFLQPTGYL